MNEAKQQRQTDDRPVVSPLVNDKTYGERVYHSIFDIGLNYWANLLSSAGFSQWAEHGNGKVPFSSKTPRELQKSLAEGIATKDPLMTGRIPFTNAKIPFFKGYVEKAEVGAGEKLAKFEEAVKNVPQLELFENAKLDVHNIKQLLIEDRSMARARSLTLLVPGFLIVVPTVWLGAKIKPWFVSKLDQHKYGAAAMDDPTLKARHDAIAAESRPTIFGAIAARFMTMAAVQVTAQAVGSEGNFVNKIGKNNEYLSTFGLNSATDKAGKVLGGAFPEKMKAGFNRFARSKKLDWSEEQVRTHLVEKGYLSKDSIGQLSTEMHAVAKKGMGDYKTATEDLGRFIATDTFYTIITACTIQPAIKLLRMIPGMSYKPKTAKDGNDGKVLQPTRVKVPANEFGEFSDRAETVTVQAAKDTTAPGLSINNASPQGTLHHHEQQIA